MYINYCNIDICIYCISLYTLVNSTDTIYHLLLNMDSLQKLQGITKRFINNSDFIVSNNVTHIPSSLSSSSNNKEPTFVYLEKGDLPTDFSIIEESINHSTESTTSPLNYLSTLLQSKKNIDEKTPSEDPDNNSTMLQSKPIEAYISIYSMNDTDAIFPFFKYLFVWNEETKCADFPKKTINIHNTNSTTNIQTQILNECIEYILDLFDLYDKFDDSFFNDMFKGFIWNHELNTVHLFFELPNIDKNPDETKVSSLKWAILDEIINKQYIDNKTIPISPAIVDLFKENVFLNTIYIINSNENPKKKRLEYPRCLYLCEVPSTTDENQLITDSSSPDTWKNVRIKDENIDISDIIDKTIDFPLLGDYYYFSTTLIDVESSETVDLPWKKEVFKKYAVFLNINNGEYFNEESYILKDVSTVTDEQWINYFKKNNQIEISTIWFKYKDLPLWAIKYPTQFCII